MMQSNGIQMTFVKNICTEG